MRLCMFNDCQCGDHEYSLRCCDCPHKDDCPERCPNEDCTNCYWQAEVSDES